MVRVTNLLSIAFWASFASKVKPWLIFGAMIAIPILLDSEQVWLNRFVMLYEKATSNSKTEETEKVLEKTVLETRNQLRLDLLMALDLFVLLSRITSCLTD